MRLSEIISQLVNRFPSVNSVVHSHASDVLPYCVSGVPLRSTTHMTGFLGSYPITELCSCY
jgi:ribulose-5-phosphate 4-epimerase/fuculose-1-phosphate aldolase